MDKIFQTTELEYEEKLNFGSSMDIVFDYVSKELGKQVVHAKAGCGNCTRNMRLTDHAVEASFIPDVNPGKGQEVAQEKYVTAYLETEGVETRITNSRGQKMINIDNLNSVALKFTVTVVGN